MGIGVYYALIYGIATAVIVVFGVLFLLYVAVAPVLHVAIGRLKCGIEGLWHKIREMDRVAVEGQLRQRLKELERVTDMESEDHVRLLRQRLEEDLKEITRVSREETLRESESPMEADATGNHRRHRRARRRASRHGRCESPERD